MTKANVLVWLLSLGEIRKQVVELSHLPNASLSVHSNGKGQQWAVPPAPNHKSRISPRRRLPQKALG